MTQGDEWIRLGVKCPRLSPFFFFGEDFRKSMSSLLDQYGDTFGTRSRFGVSLFTTNFDLLRHIFIKDFNNFVDRGSDIVSHSPFAESLFFAKGSNWRRHRQIISPTFTSGKLKLIAKIIEKSAENLTSHLERFAKSGETVPIKETTGRFTCEVIAKTGFGLDVSFIDEKESEFVDHAKKFLYNAHGLGRFIVQLLFFIHPTAFKLCNKVFRNTQLFDPVSLRSNEYFRTVLNTTVAQRRETRRQGERKRHVDFLDLLLAANKAVKSGHLETATEEEDTAVSWKSKKALKELTDEEILGHSMLIIFAGQETTATALQMCLYSLACHQDIQDTVYQEIMFKVKSVPPSPDELTSLTYTECVLNETLRMYPPVPIVTRKAKETKTYNGVTIPKGAIVQVPFFYILMDPNVWPEPDKFKPERFFPEEVEKRDPMAFVCFGHGPRICLGMRLAYLELKEALVYIVRKLKVVLNDQTEPKRDVAKVEFTPQGLLTPAKPIRLAFELRENATNN
ncbi:cytochrome P450 3A11 [Biomphalaria glabrata]|nr:cytochrome P450 3A11 [Biomphalaria glabrata]